MVVRDNQFVRAICKDIFICLYLPLYIHYWVLKQVFTICPIQQIFSFSTKKAKVWTLQSSVYLNRQVGKLYITMFRFHNCTFFKVYIIQIFYQGNLLAQTNYALDIHSWLTHCYISQLYHDSFIQTCTKQNWQCSSPRLGEDVPFPGSTHNRALAFSNIVSSIHACVH